jgi:membrane protein implicated in regulation of membrane protease activity
MASERRFFRLRGRIIEVFGRQLALPDSRIGRVAIGTLFCFGGLLWFLPVLGLWMLPLGFLILSIDIAIIRRWRRRHDVRWARWRLRRREARAARAQQARHD